MVLARNFNTDKSYVSFDFTEYFAGREAVRLFAEKVQPDLVSKGFPEVEIIVMQQLYKDGILTLADLESLIILPKPGTENKPMFNLKSNQLHFILALTEQIRQRNDGARETIYDKSRDGQDTGRKIREARIKARKLQATPSATSI